jgi:deferrochelatase/peroxidase EfeB
VFVDENHVFERLDATNDKLRQTIEDRWKKDGVDLRKDVVRVGTLGWNEDTLNELIDPSVHDRTLPCVPAEAKAYLDEMGFVLIYVRQSEAEEQKSRPSCSA